jgi:hypothetical protein
LQILCKSLLALLFSVLAFFLLLLLPFLPFKCDLLNRVRAKESRLGAVSYLVVATSSAPLVHRGRPRMPTASPVLSLQLCAIDGQRKNAPNYLRLIIKNK